MYLKDDIEGAQPCGHSTARSAVASALWALVVAGFAASARRGRAAAAAPLPGRQLTAVALADAPASRDARGLGRRHASANSGGRVNKIGEITLVFWVLKILATTLGETTGDLFSMSLGLGYYVSFAIALAVLITVLAAQISLKRCIAPVFWLAIVATTTFGTEVSDLLDRPLGLGYYGGSAVLVACLAAVLGHWHWRERDISVYPIVRVDTELLFWTAVICSNSLGTAFGDWLSDSMGLGYLQGAYITAGVIGIVMLLHYFTRLNTVMLFWVAFVFTRPFGATFGDLLTKPVSDGGMALPRYDASAVALALMAAILLGSWWWSTRRHADKQDFKFTS